MGKISKNDRVLIKALRQEKGWSSRRILKEFPNKMWSRASLDRLLKKVDYIGSTDRQQGSGRPRSARIATNIACVQEMICSQEGAPHTHKSPREIERETGISRSSVRRIAKYDLHLKTFKRVSAQKLNNDCRDKRLLRCQQLLKRYPTERVVRKIWFTDEKIFTVAKPVNAQNDRFYSSAVKKTNAKESSLVREREHFSRSIMVSVGVSRMGKTSIIFVEPGAKVNSQYYCNKLLGEGLLPDIRVKCGHFKWIFQQDGAPSHTAKNTLAYFKREKVDIIEPDMWPPNSPDLNPVDYAVWGALQQLVYQHQNFTSVEDLKEAIIEAWRLISQSFINRSIFQWRRRLECVVKQKGGHIEHMF